MAELDHLIIWVNDVAESLRFYTTIMGFTQAPDQPPFSGIRVSASQQLQLAPWGTQGHEHYAFAVTAAEFTVIADRVQAAGIDWGPTFHTVGQGGPPGQESGARGMAPTLYFPDPNNHLVEIRTYEPLPAGSVPG